MYKLIDIVSELTQKKNNNLSEHYNNVTNKKTLDKIH